MFDKDAVHVYLEVYVVAVLVSQPEREESDDYCFDDHEGFDRIWRNGSLNGPARRHLFPSNPSARRKRTLAGFVEIVSQTEERGVSIRSFSERSTCGAFTVGLALRTYRA